MVQTECELIMLACDLDCNTSTGIVMWIKIEEVDIVMLADSRNIWEVECASSGIVF